MRKKSVKSWLEEKIEENDLYALDYEQKCIEYQNSLSQYRRKKSLPKWCRKEYNEYKRNNRKV